MRLSFDTFSAILLLLRARARIATGIEAVDYFSDPVSRSTWTSRDMPDTLENSRSTGTVATASSG